MRDAVQIDYTIAMMLLPAIVLGSTVGQYLYLLLPDIITSILLVALLVFTSIKSFKKGKELWGKETKSMLEKLEPLF